MLAISSETRPPAGSGWLAPRQPCLSGIFAAFAVLLVILAPPTVAEEGPAIWFDAATGYAIGGYDPIAYFTHRSASQGRYDIEYSWRGSVWKFRNAGNRAAFERDPTVYAPRFAGYDPYDIAEGRIVAGLPVLWDIHRNKLYFFQNVIKKRIWAEDPDGVLQRAERRWPKISRSLPWH
jgi:hypothetical protein